MGAVTPVDRERPAEKSEHETPEREPCSARDVGHVLGQGDRRVALAMVGESEVVVVVAVDEPELDAVEGACGIHGLEEPRPVGMVREVAEVADLDDERAALLGRPRRQRFDPGGVAMSVAGDEDATDLVSRTRSGVHLPSVATEPACQLMSFGRRPSGRSSSRSADVY